MREGFCGRRSAKRRREAVWIPVYQYTGWIDFDKGKAWTLLTKRIHPTHHFDSGIIEIRPSVGDHVNGA
ncbi:hypothetical protein BQ8794_50585 [Mesorhizobium prunaredense]|uniref:Uncharacterized protein n=1 Tax=Mesorhizobium prunaredense TaxID=1631249 RepID=A0A1R3VGT8_9HYPH|nr:hypothetical protein BQ8794_50585 [Mesorhizobium prunaredense]